MKGKKTTIKHHPAATCSKLLLNFHSWLTCATRFMDTSMPASTPVANSGTIVYSTKFLARLFICLRQSVDLHAAAPFSHHLSTSIYLFFLLLAHLSAKDSISACLRVTGREAGDPRRRKKRGDKIDIQRFNGLSMSG